MEISFEAFLSVVLLLVFLFAVIYILFQFSGNVKDVKTVFNGTGFIVAVKTVNWNNLEELDEVHEYCSSINITNYPCLSEEECSKIVDVIRKEHCLDEYEND